MAVITWTGDPGSSEQWKEWRGYKFKKDEGVSVNDEDLIKEAESIKEFRVEYGGPGASTGQPGPGAPASAVRKLEEEYGGAEEDPKGKK